MAFTRRWVLLIILAFVFLISLLHTTSLTGKKPDNLRAAHDQPDTDTTKSDSSHQHHGNGGGGGGSSRNWWDRYVPKYPVESMISIPTQPGPSIPKLQYDFPAEEDPKRKQVREERRDAVREAFLRTWKSYKEHAWLADELGPVHGDKRQKFGGWGATVVDTMDMLWMMGLKDEFKETVEAVRQIDFSRTDETSINVFETTIRYMGGFLAAYDVSGGAYPVLLDKAVEVGDFLYVAFDTPNRLPVLRWPWKDARDGRSQVADTNNIVAELGSLTMEFTRLTQLTGDAKYYDAIQRIMDVFEKNQDSTQFPGLWPLAVDAATPSFSSDRRFTFGGMADSLYEYLPKQYLMLGGRVDQYKRMYEKAIDVAKKHLFYRPKTKGAEDILVSGYVTVNSRDKQGTLHAEGQHLTCFAGGMVAMGAKIFNRPDDLEVGRKLTEGCIWAYRSTPTGIMPEIYRAVPCDEEDKSCEWDPHLWYRDSESQDIPDADLDAKGRQENRIPGFLTVSDKIYQLRPEAIESVFLVYRMTGDASLQDKGWDMFSAIEKHTKTPLAYGSIDDVTKESPTVRNEMESFWTGETLKYFYLLFSEPDLMSLDKYVFNTEAHPLRRPE